MRISHALNMHMHVFTYLCIVHILSMESMMTQSRSVPACDVDVDVDVDVGYATDAGRMSSCSMALPLPKVSSLYTCHIAS